MMFASGMGGAIGRNTPRGMPGRSGPQPPPMSIFRGGGLGGGARGSSLLRMPSSVGGSDAGMSIRRAREIMRRRSAGSVSAVKGY